jgi:3-deoxy-D-manno-octulosonic-acid transferase
MILRLYTLINIIFTPFLMLLLLLRVVQKKEDLNRIKEKLGISDRKKPKKKVIWFHAASVGETISVIPLLDALKHTSECVILLTSGTLTSTKILKSHLSKNIIHQFIPLENYFAIRNFLKHWKPTLAVFLESEFWPCILNETAKTTKIISLNTRISDKSFQSWKSHNYFFKEIASLFSLFLPQSILDSKRLKTLGAKKIKHIGNLKYGSPSLHFHEQKFLHLNESLKGRKVVLFASTHPKEEKIITNIFHELKDQHKSLIFIIAPRHPHRGNKIFSMINRQKYKAILRSKSRKIPSDTDFYISDTVGEMGTLFRISPISIICGSFVNIGGHNPIEAAKLKSSIIIGPYYDNFKEICKDLKKNKAAIFVKNQKECVKAINLLLSDKYTSRKYVYNALTLINSKNNLLEGIASEIKKYIK